jgi:SAM-dependent methyltransferase
MRASVRPLIPESAPVFPFTLGEVRASLALCPPGAFHVTGLRLERLGPDEWWGDLVGYRDDLGAPFTWQGFRIRRGRGFQVTAPPYLLDLDGVWRALVSSTVQRLVAAGIGDPTAARGDALFVAVERAAGLPGPGNVGGERVMPAAAGVGTWLSLAKRYRFAADIVRQGHVLAIDAGPGSRMLARVARRVVAIDASLDAIRYTARAWRSPRLSLAAAEARLPFRDGAFDAVVWLDAPIDGEALLPELARVLNADGQLVLGCATRTALAPLHARLGRWFTTMTPWSQLGAPDGGDLTTGWEIEAGVHDDAAHTLVVARRAGEPSPRRNDEALVAATAHLEAGHLGDAFNTFAAILRVEPRNVSALVGAAHCALAIDDTPAARTLLRHILTVEPTHPGAIATLVELDRPA